MENTSHLSESKISFEKMVEEIELEENEREVVIKRIQDIEKRVILIQEELGVMTHKRDCLDVLLIEIDKGYDKILASSQCLSVLAARKLRMLKRKYSKYI